MAYVGVVLAQRNLHTLEPGQVFRAGQMSGPRLTRCIEEHGIRSVLNLRGRNEDKEWYRAELEATDRLAVMHYDIRLSSTEEVGPAQAEEIVGLLRTVPKPLLIHCEAGADRSGLVSALYRYKLQGLSAEEAGRELAIWYGHAPLIRRATIAMDRSFWNYVRNDTAKTRAEMLQR